MRHLLLRWLRFSLCYDPYVLDEYAPTRVIFWHWRKHRKVQRPYRKGMRPMFPLPVGPKRPR